MPSRLAITLAVLVLLAGCGAPDAVDPFYPAYDPVTPCEPYEPPQPHPDPLAGMINAILPSVSATSPTPNLRLEFEVCDPDAFFREGSRAVARLLVVTSQPEPLIADVILPAGVTLVSGGLSYDDPAGGLASNPDPADWVHVIDLEAVLKGEPGRHQITEWSELLGESYSTYGSRMAPRWTVGLEGDATGGRTFEARDPPYPNVTLGMNVEAADPSHVRATFFADQAWSGRTQFYANPRNDPQVPFTLAAHQAGSGSVVVDLPDDWVQEQYDGTYQVHFWVYPDPAISGQVFTISRYYDMQDGKIVVLEESPPVAYESGTETPEPCNPCH